MSKPSKHVVNFGDEVVEVGEIEEVDLDRESISHDGKRLTEADVEPLVEKIRRRGGGRPSIDQAAGQGHRSPQVAFRVSKELKADLTSIAERDGRRESDVLRQALEEYVTRHKSA